MLLDELIEFDLRELTAWKIIYSFYKKWWLAVLALLFGGVGIFFYLALSLSFYPAKAICLLLMSGCLLLTFVFSKNKTLHILIKHARQHHLPINGLWEHRKVMIEKIREKKLSAFIAGHEQMSNAKIIFFLEELTKNQGPVQSQSQFAQIAVSLVSVILASFFAAVAVVKNQFTTFNTVIVFFKPFAGLLLMFLLLYWFFQTMVTKWVAELKHTKLTRLRKVLANYLAERL